MVTRVPNFSPSPFETSQGLTLSYTHTSPQTPVSEPQDTMATGGASLSNGTNSRVSGYVVGREDIQVKGETGEAETAWSTSLSASRSSSSSLPRPL